MKQAIAIDFDGTITKDAKFPIIGEENYWLIGSLEQISRTAMAHGDYISASDISVNDGIHVIDGDDILAPATHVIKQLSSKYDIVIHTCRTGESQKMMEDWLKTKAHTSMHKGHDYQINYNGNCPEANEKPFADVYLDNRGLTWTEKLNVPEAIENLIKSLPKHDYIPQK